MKNLGKKLIGWMLCLAMAVAMLPGMARGAEAVIYEKEGIKYDIDDDNHTAWVVGYTTEIPVEVKIPDKINGYDVLGIDDKAFADCAQLHDITIPSSVTEIGSNAFWRCTSLVSIVVDEGNKNFSSVEGVLFSKDDDDVLTSLLCCPQGHMGNESTSKYTIPETVKTISSSAFYGCSNLTSITLPSGLTSIEDSTFYGCSNLRSITLPSGLTSIGKSAFCGCSSLTSILLPSGLTSIGNDAFSGCNNLHTVWLPEGKIKSFGNTNVFPSLHNIITYGVNNYSFPTNLTYNGIDQADAIKALISVKQGEDTLEEGENKAYQVLFSSDSGKNWNAKCINAGTYQIKLVGGDTAEGYIGEVTDANWTFTISQLDLSCITADANTTFTYDGTDQQDRIKKALCFKQGTEDLSLAESDYTVIFYDSSSEQTESVLEAGEYKVKVLGSGVNCIGAQFLDVRIEKISGLTVSLDDATYEYDGSAHSIANSPVTNAISGTTTFTYSFEENGTYVEDLSSLTKTNVGVYTVYVKATNPNYSNVATTTATLEITKKAITIKADSDSKEYDGTPLRKNSFTSTDLATGDKIETLTVTGSQTDAGDSANVPSDAKIVNAAGVDVTSCYEITYENGVLDVNAVEDEVVVTIVGNTDTKTYDGKSHSIEGFTYSVKRGNDEVSKKEFTVTLSGDKKAVASATDAGTYAMGLTEKEFTVTAVNYSSIKVVYTDGTLTIEPAKATITVNSVSKTEGEADPAFTGTVEGLVAEGDLGAVAYRRTNADEAPGTYKGVVTATYTANPNYDVTVVNGDFTVLAKEKGTYKAVSGADGSYTQENSGNLTFSFKRTENDASTFDHFKGVEVDGKAVPEKDNSGRVNWTAKRGSVIIELQPAFLDTLSAGEHLIKVIFDDGESSAIFKILEAIATPTPTVDTTPTVTPTVDATPTVTPAVDTTATVTPSLDATPTVTPAADATPVTGDAANPFLWIAMILMSMAGVAVMVEKKRRRA